jgi:Fe-only nitrogenase accessory protein AnfO
MARASLRVKIISGPPPDAGGGLIQTSGLLRTNIMKIAAIINEAGKVVSRFERAQLCLYEQGPGGWTLKKQLGVELHDHMGLAEVKARLKHACSQLEDCQVFLVEELRGLLHVLLLEMKFSVWKSEGEIAKQMDFIAQKEAEADSIVPQPLPAPHPVGSLSDGHYRINLVEAMANDSSLNSKQILIPILEKFAFQKLEIICDHLPRWFPQECERLNLLNESESPQDTGHGLKVIIRPKGQAEGRLGEGLKAVFDHPRCLLI